MTLPLGCYNTAFHHCRRVQALRRAWPEGTYRALGYQGPWGPAPRPKFLPSKMSMLSLGTRRIGATRQGCLSAASSGIITSSAQPGTRYLSFFFFFPDDLLLRLAPANSSCQWSERVIRLTPYKQRNTKCKACRSIIFIQKSDYHLSAKSNNKGQPKQTRNQTRTRPSLSHEWAP